MKGNWSNYILPLIGSIAATIAGPVVWIFISYGIGVSERYLPAPHTVLADIVMFGPSLLFHFAVSFARILIGYGAGVVVGLLLAEFLFRYNWARAILLPNIHAFRAVPAAASVPFFILWFGFSEIGKVAVFVFGISFNLAVAAWQILNQMPDRYVVALKGFFLEPHAVSRRILLPMVVEQLLPTLRFSLTIAIGLGVVAEFLGAQSGLGYLIQSARATYSMGIIFACMALFGIMTILMDTLVRVVWKLYIPWKPMQET